MTEAEWCCDLGCQARCSSVVDISRLWIFPGSRS